MASSSWLAHERVLQMCTAQASPQGDQPLNHDTWREHMDALAARGQCVRAVPRRHVNRLQDSLHHDHVQSELTLLGLVGIIDPPRAPSRV